MSELVEVLYPVPDLRRTPLSSLRWWESKRLLFNQVVGGTGLVTLAGITALFAVGPSTLGGLELLPMLFGAAVYGIAANVCYSMGWVAERLASALWGRQSPDLGPILFRQGLIFSVGLTLFPLLVFSFVWVLHVIMAFAS